MLIRRCRSDCDSTGRQKRHRRNPSTCARRLRQQQKMICWQGRLSATSVERTNGWRIATCSHMIGYEGGTRGSAASLGRPWPRRDSCSHCPNRDLQCPVGSANRPDPHRSVALAQPVSQRARPDHRQLRQHSRGQDRCLENGEKGNAPHTPEGRPRFEGNTSGGSAPRLWEALGGHPLVCSNGCGGDGGAGVGTGVRGGGDRERGGMMASPSPPPPPPLPPLPPPPPCRLWEGNGTGKGRGSYRALLATSY